MRAHLAGLVLVLLLAGCGPVAASGLAVSRGNGAASAHAARDPVAAVKAANAVFARRDAALVAEKYAKMAETPFGFFRGTAHLYYADVRQEGTLATSIRLPLQGDLHLENLGTYRTASGAVAFDLNDFDEAFTGPYTWELARLAVSLHLATGEASSLVDFWLARYRHHLATLDPASLARPLTAERLQGPAVTAIAEAEAVTRAAFLDKLTKQGRFKLGKKIRAIPAATAAALRAAVAEYAVKHRAPEGFFAVKDAAARVAGTASIGRYRYVVRVEGPTASNEDDVVLEIKEQGAPAGGADSGDPAERVKRAYGYFLPAPDPFLGTVRLAGESFLVRELSPAKNDVAIDDLSREAFRSYLDTVALAAARAHARSGRGAAIADELEAKAPAIAAFAARYADQVRSDHAAFKRTL